MKPLRSAAMAALGLLAAAGTPPPVTDLQPIILHDGVNVVPGFLPDGAAATIVQAWRANGNAHSHHDWLVLGSAAEQHGAVEATLTDPRSGQLDDLIGDAPFDGERVLGNVRFARGMIDGKAAALLLQAMLDDPPGSIPADHATATIRVFRLEADDNGPGSSPLVFRLVSSMTTSKRYCNAALALSQVLAVPLPADYGGPNKVDGCFPS